MTLPNHRRPMARITRIVELVRTRRSAQRLTVTEIADTLEVSTKTVRRDLDFMRDGLDIPIRFNYAKETYEFTAEVKLPWQ